MLVFCLQWGGDASEHIPEKWHLSFFKAAILHDHCKDRWKSVRRGSSVNIAPGGGVERQLSKDGTFSTFFLPLNQAGAMLEPEYASFPNPLLTLPVIYQGSQTPHCSKCHLYSDVSQNNPGSFLRVRFHASNQQWIWQSRLSLISYHLTLNLCAAAHLLEFSYCFLCWWLQVANRNPYPFFLREPS